MSVLQYLNSMNDNLFLFGDLQHETVNEIEN